MYERSAIVLEKYFKELFGFNKKINLKTNYKNFGFIVSNIENYQKIVEDEETIIDEFDEIAENIHKIQKNQEKLYKSNIKLEEDRFQLFNDFDSSPIELDKKLEKIRNSIEKNNQDIDELKSQYITNMDLFLEKQKQRNKSSKSRRIVEGEYFYNIEKVTKDFESIDTETLKKVKDFIKMDDILVQDIENELKEIMLENGKEEKIKFDKDVIEVSVKEKISISKREAECYIAIYDKMKKLLLDVSNDNIKVSKYQKILKDVGAKLEFLESENSYIVNFLDYERMTSLNGKSSHKAMMAEACENFRTDIKQINNLYELVLREIAGKSTKKAYNELYNKSYLKEVEENEKSFEEEANNIKIKAGTLINSSYWRIEGIKNIYTSFEEIAEEKFEKDLSEYREEEQDDETEELIEENIFTSDTKFFNKNKTQDDDEDEEEIEYLDEDIMAQYDEEDEKEDDDEIDESIFESDSIFLKREDFEDEDDDKDSDDDEDEEQQDEDEKSELEEIEEVEVKLDEKKEKYTYEIDQAFSEETEILKNKKQKDSKKKNQNKESKGVFKSLFKSKK